MRFCWRALDDDGEQEPRVFTSGMYNIYVYLRTLKTCMDVSPVGPLLKKGVVCCSSWQGRIGGCIYAFLGGDTELDEGCEGEGGC